MEDHHVDRPGVEAQQCVELTGTNRSFGLITLILYARQGDLRERPTGRKFDPMNSVLRFAGLVAIARGKAPDPIPNSAVKTPSADGTVS